MGRHLLIRVLGPVPITSSCLRSPVSELQDHHLSPILLTVPSLIPNRPWDVIRE